MSSAISKDALSIKLFAAVILRWKVLETQGKEVHTDSDCGEYLLFLLPQLAVLSVYFTSVYLDL